MNQEYAVVTLIDRILPQTQCRQCGYAGCLPYANAIADGSADINRCPPGGEEVIEELAQLLQRQTLPLDPALAPAPPSLARIEETHCIGCTLCISACPVDAIIGARQLMHTVLADHCTGCGLCLPPCPVDCIALLPTKAPSDRDRQRQLSTVLRERHAARLRRLSLNAPAKHHHTRPAESSEDKAAVLRRITRRAQQRLELRGISCRQDAGDTTG